MISFLLASVLSAQANPVTVEIEIAPAEVVLEKLGKEMGVEMIPGGSVSKDVFGIAFTKAPTAKVLSEIATTLNAQWERSPSGTYILNRTPKQESDEDRAMQEQLRKSIEQQLAKTKNQGEFTEKTAIQLITEAQKLVSLSNDDTPSPRLEAISQQTPIARLLNSVLQEIDPAELIRPWTELPVSYSINPSRGQKSLPASLQAAFRKFEAESKIHDDALDALGVTNGMHSGRFHRIFQSLLGRASSKINYTLNTVLLNGTTLVTNLRVNADGNASDMATRTFGLEVEAAKASYGPLGQGLTEAIPLASEEELLLKRGDVPNPGLRRMIENFATKDLLAYFSEAPFRLLAKAKQVDRVILLADTHWQWDYSSYPPNGLSLEQFFQEPILPYRYRVAIEYGTLRVRPMNPRGAREGRFPRQAMTKALADLDRLKYPDIEVVASLAGETETNQILFSAIGYVEKASGISYGSVASEVHAMDILRLYGRLGPPEREKARSGGLILDLPLRPASSEAILQKMIHLKRTLVAEFPEYEGVPIGHSLSGDGNAEVEQDIAAVLADGYPRSSQVRIRLDIIPRVFRLQNMPGRGKTITMPSLSTVGMVLERIKGANVPSEPEFAVAPNAELVIDVDFQAKRKMRFVVLHRQSQAELEFGHAEDLPPEIRKQIDAAYKIFRERMAPPPGTGGRR